MSVTPVWLNSRADDFDLYIYAREVLDLAIECVKTDGYLQSGAFVITARDIHYLTGEFTGQAEKERAYSEIVTYARSIKAEAANIKSVN
jgi:hypothetical protein